VVWYVQPEGLRMFSAAVRAGLTGRVFCCAAHVGSSHRAQHRRGCTSAKRDTVALRRANVSSSPMEGAANAMPRRRRLPYLMQASLFWGLPPPRSVPVNNRKRYHIGTRLPPYLLASAFPVELHNGGDGAHRVLRKTLGSLQRAGAWLGVRAAELCPARLRGDDVLSPSSAFGAQDQQTNILWASWRQRGLACVAKMVRARDSAIS